jgi:hypothetical protein
MSTLSLFIGIPCYGGQMHVGCTNSLLNLVQQCTAHKIDYKFEFIYNQSIITLARNTIASRFMQSGFTHLLFIDADIQFEAADIIKMIQADKDIIGGLYSKKIIDWHKISKCVAANKTVDSLKYSTSDMAVYFLDNIGSSESVDINEPLEVQYIATGMMLIKRCVFETMKEKYDVSTYDYQEYNHPDEKHYAFFDCEIKNNTYMSEDFYLCDRWRQVGGKIFAALWTKTVHYGSIGFHTDVAQK